ncbi:unnamed protein product, partial [Cylindrotheca closterium]
SSIIFFGGKNLLDDYASIPLVDITAAATSRTDARAKQNSKALFAKLLGSTTGALQDKILKTNGNLPNHEDGPTLFKEMIDTTAVSSVLVSMTALAELDPGDFEYKMPSVNIELRPRSTKTPPWVALAVTWNGRERWSNESNRSCKLQENGNLGDGILNIRRSITTGGLAGSWTTGPWIDLLVDHWSTARRARGPLVHGSISSWTTGPRLDVLVDQWTIQSHCPIPIAAAGICSQLARRLAGMPGKNNDNPNGRYYQSMLYITLKRLSMTNKRRSDGFAHCFLDQMVESGANKLPSNLWPCQIRHLLVDQPKMK